MESKTIIPIEFNRVFDEKPSHVSEYLKHIPHEIIVQYALFMANHTIGDDVERQICFFKFDKYIPQYILRKLTINYYPECRYVLFTPHCGLELLKILYAHSIDNTEAIKNGGPIDLLKAILQTNSDLLSRGSHFKDDALELFAKAIRSYKYSLDDRITVYPTVYRSFCLLHFLEENTSEKWTMIYNCMLKRLQTDSLHSYLTHSLDIFEELTVTPKESNTMLVLNDKSSALYDFIKKESFDIRTKISLADNSDYTYFKTHPFIRFSDTRYGVISNIFVSNLMYNKLKFCIRDICEEEKICNFFSSFNTDFIEKYLFAQLLNYSFSKHNYECFTEDECEKYSNGVDKKELESLPDGYVRFNGKILLLECKGKIISVNALSDEKKCCADIGDIVGKKGTGQLIHNCNRIIHGKCFWDKKYP